MAVFIDGLNDFGSVDGQPEATDRLADFVNQVNKQQAGAGTNRWRTRSADCQ